MFCNIFFICFLFIMINSEMISLKDDINLYGSYKYPANLTQYNANQNDTIHITTDYPASRIEFFLNHLTLKMIVIV